MAKTSIKARQQKRLKLVAQHAAKREELKAAGDWKALDEMPKNSSKVRLKNRCQITGLDITFVTTANTDEEAYELLKELGMPFRNAKKDSN